MRILLLILWLLVPVGAVAFHFGPGQDLLKHDHAAKVLREADGFRVAGRLDEAQQALEKGLELLPPSEVAARQRVRLELCKVLMDNRGLPVANQELNSLISELDADPEADPDLVADCRETLANSQYYMTWLMRLEGLTEEVWGTEIESAQQNLRMLAGSAVQTGEMELAARHREDLEAAARLARMDLGELRGLPLPNQ